MTCSNIVFQDDEDIVSLDVTLLETRDKEKLAKILEMENLKQPDTFKDVAIGTPEIPEAQEGSVTLIPPTKTVFIGNKYQKVQQDVIKERSEAELNDPENIETDHAVLEVVKPVSDPVIQTAYTVSENFHLPEPTTEASSVEQKEKETGEKSVPALAEVRGGPDEISQPVTVNQETSETGDNGKEDLAITGATPVIGAGWDGGVFGGEAGIDEVNLGRGKGDSSGEATVTGHGGNRPKPQIETDTEKGAEIVGKGASVGLASEDDEKHEIFSTIQNFVEETTMFTLNDENINPPVSPEASTTSKEATTSASLAGLKPQDIVSNSTIEGQHDTTKDAAEEANIIREDIKLGSTTRRLPAIYPGGGATLSPQCCSLPPSLPPLFRPDHNLGPRTPAHNKPQHEPPDSPYHQHPLQGGYHLYRSYSRPIFELSS